MTSPATTHVGAGVNAIEGPNRSYDLRGFPSFPLVMVPGRREPPTGTRPLSPDYIFMRALVHLAILTGCIAFSAVPRAVWPKYYAGGLRDAAVTATQTRAREIQTDWKL